LRMPERFSFSWSIIIRNGLLMVYKCKHYKATLLAGTSRCGESIIITSSEGLDWKQSCTGYSRHCRWLGTSATFKNIWKRTAIVLQTP
jgi:hypothetical protein